MQEYILKEKVLEYIKQRLCPKWVLAHTYLIEEIDSLPTTELHKYEVGDICEFANYWSWFTIWKFNGYCCDGIAYDLIRPLSKEHPDITQARELASRHWFQLTKI